MSFNLLVKEWERLIICFLDLLMLTSEIFCKAEETYYFFLDNLLIKIGYIHGTYQS